MRITDTLAGARDNAMQHMSETKMERTAKANDELRTENRLLREELAENRSERKQVLDLLDKAQISVRRASRRGPKVLRLITIGVAAYAVLIKSGAVNRVKLWADRMRPKSERFGSDLASKGSELSHQVGDTIEHTGRKLERAGETIKRTSQRTGN